MADAIERVKGKVVYAEDILDLFYVASAGQDKAFVEVVEDVIENAPTADVEEVKHGTWLPQIVNGIKSWDCSECKTLGIPHWKRCPICEAKMDGGKAE